MLNVQYLLSFIFKNESVCQRMVDTNHHSVVNVEQRIGRGRNTWLDRQWVDSQHWLRAGTTAYQHINHWLKGTKHRQGRNHTTTYYLIGNVISNTRVLEGIFLWGESTSQSELEITTFQISNSFTLHHYINIYFHLQSLSSFLIDHFPHPVFSHFIFPSTTFLSPHHPPSFIRNNDA